jgi:hypothetical protein
LKAAITSSTSTLSLPMVSRLTASSGMTFNTSKFRRSYFVLERVSNRDKRNWMLSTWLEPTHHWESSLVWCFEELCFWCLRISSQ